MMKTVSVLIPCYNEEENIRLMAEAVCGLFESQLPNYRYELVFIDNDSKDNTRKIIRDLCQENNCIKAIFNAKNFGQFNSPYYGLLNTQGDCTILMACDFQDPVEMIPKFIEQWEKGYKIVCGIKTSSRENFLIYHLRTIYYKVIKKFSSVEQIEHFTGFGLYDKSFINVLRELDDPTPFLRGIVAELGFRRTMIPYEQNKRMAGKSHNNWYSLYDAAMLSFTSYTKIGLRIATFLGAGMATVCAVLGVVYLIEKLLFWDKFTAGMAPLLIGMFFIGAVQIFFLGFLGEYILSMNQRIMKRPLVIEEERINFEENNS